MSSTVLKIIALVSMLIDHMGLLLFPEYPIFRILGRLSFPLFCFLLAQGFVHTKSRKEYFGRLCVFALVSEIPYQLFIAGRLRSPLLGSNIFFTLVLGFGAMVFLEKAAHENVFWGVVPVFFCIAAQLLNFSYGAYGISLISLFYLLRKSRALCLLSLAVCTLGYCIYYKGGVQGYAVAAGVLFLFYNRKKGWEMPRYFFYAFYPTHLLALYLLQNLLGESC